MEIVGYISVVFIVFLMILFAYGFYKMYKGGRLIVSSVEGTSWKGIIEAVIKVVEKKFREKEIIDIPLPDEKKKKEITRKSLKSFYYLDENQINYLLPQIKDEKISLTRIETNESNSSNISIKAAPLPLEANTENNNSKQRKQIYEVKETGVVKMYQEIEAHFFNSAEIKFGLEDIPREKIYYGVELFKEKCNELKVFGYEISEEEQKNHIEKHLSKNMERAVQRISKTTGYIALQIDTELTEKGDTMYELTYDHPLNEFLFNDSDKPMKFKLLCIKSNVTQNGMAILKKNRKFNVTAIGKITGWDSDNRILEIVPIAIY